MIQKNKKDILYHEMVHTNQSKYIINLTNDSIEMLKSIYEIDFAHFLYESN